VACRKNSPKNLLKSWKVGQKRKNINKRRGRNKKGMFFRRGLVLKEKMRVVGRCAKKQAVFVEKKGHKGDAKIYYTRSSDTQEANIDSNGEGEGL